MEPRRDAGNVRFRIDGVLHQVYQIPTPVMAAMTSRIKILGRMDVVEKRRPQDGRIKTRTPDGDEVELRLSTMPTAFGEKLVMRIFNPDVLVKDFTELGFSEEDKERWSQLVTRPHGIILVTGPTGSGKTTTLYSTLKQLAQPDVNVCTIEDPIEMVEPQFNQMQVQAAIGLDFAAGVRTLMRQDPDIIMVGEIRDQETADMAIQAALTGHLVLSTLHTNDAPSAVTRLLDIGVEPYLLHSTILGVLAQRLVRTLCPHCREPVTIDEETWRSLTLPWRLPLPPVELQRARLPGVPHDRLHGPHRDLRDDAHDARPAQTDPCRDRSCGGARAGDARRHEAAARQRRAQGRRRHDHRGRGAEGGAAHHRRAPLGVTTKEKNQPSDPCIRQRT